MSHNTGFGMHETGREIVCETMLLLHKSLWTRAQLELTRLNYTDSFANMRFLSLVLLAGTALANPLAEIQARALNPSQSSSCSASYTGSCRSTLLSSASTFCASLGYGTTVNTVRTTTTINRYACSFVLSYQTLTKLLGPSSVPSRQQWVPQQSLLGL